MPRRAARRVEKGQRPLLDGRLGLKGERPDRLRGVDDTPDNRESRVAKRDMVPPAKVKRAGGARLHHRPHHRFAVAGADMNFAEARVSGGRRRRFTHCMAGQMGERRHCLSRVARGVGAGQHHRLHRVGRWWGPLHRPDFEDRCHHRFETQLPRTGKGFSGPGLGPQDQEPCHPEKCARRVGLA